MYGKSDSMNRLIIFKSGAKTSGKNNYTAITCDESQSEPTLRIIEAGTPNDIIYNQQSNFSMQDLLGKIKISKYFDGINAINIVNDRQTDFVLSPENESNFVNRLYKEKYVKPKTKLKDNMPSTQKIIILRTQVMIENLENPVYDSYQNKYATILCDNTDEKCTNIIKDFHKKYPKSDVLLDLTTPHARNIWLHSFKSYINNVSSQDGIYFFNMNKRSERDLFGNIFGSKKYEEKHLYNRLFGDKNIPLYGYGVGNNRYGFRHEWQDIIKDSK